MVENGARKLSRKIRIEQKWAQKGPKKCENSIPLLRCSQQSHPEHLHGYYFRYYNYKTTFTQAALQCLGCVWDTENTISGT